VIALLLTALSFLSWQTPSADVLQHLQAGAQAEREGKFDTAISEFRTASELDPKASTSFVHLGQAYIEATRYADAVAPLQQALTLDHDLVAAHQLLGYALLAQGYAAEAVGHLAKTDDKAALGIAQTESGSFAEAVPNLQLALTRRPNDPDLLYYLGRASGLLSKESMDTLLATYPESARAHQAMAENYFVLRQMPQAEKEYIAALKVRPDAPNLHLELGQVYAGSSQWDKAEQEFRTETKLQPGNAEAAYRLGNALLQQGKAREAQSELRRADHLKPDMPETLYALGKAASLQGDSATAEKAWTKVISMEPATPLAAQSHFALAGLYRKQGKAADAQRELEEFKKATPSGNEQELPK
jgi:tetratricopeptide (TPR) repeat protein